MLFPDGAPQPHLFITEQLPCGLHNHVAAGASSVASQPASRPAGLPALLKVNQMWVRRRTLSSKCSHLKRPEHMAADMASAQAVFKSHSLVTRDAEARDGRSPAAVRADKDDRDNESMKQPFWPQISVYLKQHSEGTSEFTWWRSCLRRKKADGLRG